MASRRRHQTSVELDRGGDAMEFAPVNQTAPPAPGCRAALFEGVVGCPWRSAPCTVDNARTGTRYCRGAVAGGRVVPTTYASTKSGQARFDIGTLLHVANGTIGLGFSVGDEEIPQPYWYVRAYPAPAGDPAPGVLPFGEWHLQGRHAASFAHPTIRLRTTRSGGAEHEHQRSMRRVFGRNTTHENQK